MCMYAACSPAVCRHADNTCTPPCLLSYMKPIRCCPFSSMFMTAKLNFYVSIDLPPPKRRRTLAGSIISTALSAALIGTAVGLTGYRLRVLSRYVALKKAHSMDRWRDRGKNPEPLPPPPYEQGGWVPPEVCIQTLPAICVLIDVAA